MRNDPFAKLGALDQKLFAKPTPLPAASPVPDTTPANSQLHSSLDRSQPEQSLYAEQPKEVGKEGSREVRKEGSSETSFALATPPATPLPFGVNAKPYRKDSFLFTDEEFEAMEDLKIELRRKYEVKAIKNDIARCAIGFLISDFERNRDKSFVVRHLRTKK